MNYKDELIKHNQKIIRALNPGTKVEYPVEYASLDNNAVFVAARIINSMGFDFLNYEDIFKQDFLAAAEYTDHYTIDDPHDYDKRLYPAYSKKPFFRIQDGAFYYDALNDTFCNTSFDEAIKYNEDMIYGLYPTLWKYCSDNIVKNGRICVNIEQNTLTRIFNEERIDWLFERIAKLPSLFKAPKPFVFLFPCIVGNDENLQLSKKVIDYFRCDGETDYEVVYRISNNRNQILENFLLYSEKGKLATAITQDNLWIFESSFNYICSLFEYVTTSLVRDCCMLINQIKMNTAAGRNIMYPVYDTSQQLQQPQNNGQQTQSEPIQLVSVMPGMLGESNAKSDITQDAISEMAATAEPELLNSLSAEELMPSLQETPYANAGLKYSDVEMDIVKYIMQDMIDAAKAV